MIEAPEARILAAQITRILRGRVVTDVIANTTPHKFAFFADFSQGNNYAELLQGQRITGAEAVGGMVRIFFEIPNDGINRTYDTNRCCFVFTDGCRAKYFAPGAELPAKHQLLIAFDDESCLIFSVQMYGMLWAFGEGDGWEHGYYRTACERPNLYSDSFTEEYFRALASDTALQNKSVKALLATEQRIPGLGNGVLQDMLLRARVHPKRKVSSLSDPEIADLYRTMRHTADEMLRLGGRNTESDLFGQKGGYAVLLGAKALGEVCPVCGMGIVRREAYLGGNIYYCPECQPLG